MVERTLPLGATWKRLPLLLVGAVLLASACDGSTESSDTSPLPGADDGPSGGDVFSVAFESQETLRLEPGEKARLRLLVSPPARRQVEFSLLSEDASSLQDASLDVTQAWTDERGIVEVTLRAPSSPATFAVRAALDAETETRLAVSVSSLGFGKLIIHPKYVGQRAPTLWTASVRAGFHCQELTNPNSDGPIAVTGTAPLTLDSIPSGPDIAVTLRSGQLAAGCLTVTRLESEEIREITVIATDLPLRASTGALRLQFGIESASPEFGAMLDEAIGSAVRGFTGESTTDAQFLLDGVQQRIPSVNDRTLFASLRSSAGFDALTGTHLGEPLVLRARVQSLLTQAALSLTSKTTFRGRLVFNEQNASFTLEEAASVPGSSSGFSVGSTWSYSNEADDKLVLGGALEYQAPRFLARVAEVQATQKKNLLPPQALLELTQCESWADKLVEAASGEVYPACGKACLEDLCEQTVQGAWSRVSTSDPKLTRLTIAMSGAANLASDARVSSFSGTWVGTLNSSSAAVRGPALGEQLDD